MRIKIIKQFVKKIPPIDEIRPLQAYVAAVVVVTLFVLFTIMGVFHVTGVKTQYTLRQFFPVHHPLLRQDDEVKARFSLGDGSPFLIVANIESANDDWSKKEHLDAVKTLTEKIKAMPAVKDVSDISTLQGAVQTGGELGIGAMVDYLTPRLFKRELDRNHILSPLFVSRDAHILTIFVTPIEQSTAEMLTVKTALMAAAKAELPFASVDIGGVPAIQSDVNAILNQEVLRFIMVAIFMSLIALAVIFKNVYPIIVCTATAFITNIMSVWGIAVFGFSFNVLSSTIPILVTMTVISISIHSILRLIERRAAMPKGTKFHVVLWRTQRELFRPNLLTALTTSVGFFTLTLSEAPIIKEFGLSVAIALLFTWVNTTLLLPALLLLGPRPHLRTWMKAKARWAFHIMRYNKVILVVVIGLSLFGAWKGQTLSWSARLFDDLPKDHAVRRTTELVDRYLGGLVPLDIEVKLPDSSVGPDGSGNPWAQMSMIDGLDRVSKEIAEQKGVGSSITMSDILRSSGLMKGAQKATPSEVMFLLSMSPQNPLRQFVSTDNLSTRISVRLKDIPGARMWRLVQDIHSMVKAQFPSATIRMAGTAAYVHDINNALSKDLLFGFWQAMLVIFVLLVISYRSITWAILACLPNLTPPALLLGTLSLTRVPIKPCIAIILSISLGLAFNNTVYLLERMRDLMAKGLSYQKALVHTFWSESNPCFFASVVLIVGFAGFAVSYFKMNQLFGVFMVLSVLTGLLGDLVLLPALLKFIYDQGVHLFNLRRARGAILALLLATSVACLVTHERVARAANANSAANRGSASTKPIAEDPELTKLGTSMQNLISTRDESGTITMKVTEPDGTSKVREISYSRLNNSKSNSHFTLMRMVTPKDMKGMAILSVIKKEEEEKWVYLPASKQTRKISTAEGNARVLDSELYSEDFDLNIIKTASSKITKTAPDGAVDIETTLAADKGAYSKTICHVGADKLLKSAEVFDKKGALLKTIQFLDYTQVAPGKWRALKIAIENVQNKRKTELALADVKVEIKLKEDDFSTRALAEGF